MQDVNFNWQQGEDTYLNFRFKEGPSKSKAMPVNLASGYTAKLTLANPNSPTTPLVVCSTENGDILLFTGINEPNIKVKLRKEHTLPPNGLLPVGSYVYDLFVRNTGTGDQIKVVEGTINVRRSITLWSDEVDGS